MLAGQSPEEILKQAREKIQTGDLAGARQLLGLLTRQHKDFIDGWIWFGQFAESDARKEAAWMAAHQLNPSDPRPIQALSSIGITVQAGPKPEVRTMTALPERPMDDAERAAFAAAANAPAQPAAQSPAAPAAPVVPQVPQLITPPRKRFRDYIPAKWRKKAASLVETPVSGTPEHPSTGATQPNLGATLAPPAASAASAATAAPPRATIAPAAPPGRPARSRLSAVLILLACALSLTSAVIAWRTTSDLRNAYAIFATQTATAGVRNSEEPPPADATPQALPTDAANPAPEATAAPAAPDTTPTNAPTATRPPVPTVPSAPTDTPAPAVSGQLVPAGDQLIVPADTPEPGR